MVGNDLYLNTDGSEGVLHTGNSTKNKGDNGDALNAPNKKSKNTA